MKAFTSSDVKRGGLPTIYAEKEELIDSPLDWQRQGLQQTATGYGRKLTSRYKIRYNGKDYRLYATCFSNAASHWFITFGEKVYVN